MSARQLTVSLEGLNGLYCKYLTECIIQYLPRDLTTEVNALINMRSAIDVYKYLDGKLSCLQNMQNIQTSNGNINIERKPRQSKNISSGSNIQMTNNSSSIDRRAYLEDDKEKVQTRRMNSLLKRANTLFQRPEDREKALSNGLMIGEQKQHKVTQLQSPQPSATTKKTPSQSHSTNYIPMQSYRQQTDTLNENRLYQSPDYKKQLTDNNKLRQQEKMGDKSSNSFGLRLKQSEEGNFHKEKTQGNHNNSTGSENGSVGKIEFARTYSTKETQDGNAFATRNSTVNRSKLLASVRQARQIFADNAKKILRYENLSSDLATIQTGNKMVQGVINGYSNGGSYGYNFMGKRY